MTSLSSPALVTRSRAGRGSGPSLASRLVREDGAMLLEVLMASVILAIGILGLTVMFSAGTSFVAAQGDNRVAMFLAEQKLEKLRALGFAGLQTGDQTATSGCVANRWTSPEPCYSETGRAGVGGTTQTFARTTCVNFVQDKNPALPALTAGSPPGCPADCVLSGTCTKKTKRITVTVKPTTMQANTGDAVTLETVVSGP